MKRRKASVVTTKPSGTGSPARESSARLEALLPARWASPGSRSSKGNTSTPEREPAALLQYLVDVRPDAVEGPLELGG